MRKWLPSFAELIDRLSIHQLKEVMIPEHKDKYSEEIRMIIHDIDDILASKEVKLDGELILAFMSIAQINSHIWYNESKARKGEDQDLRLLKLTHGLNGIRSRLTNLISSKVGDGIQDYKSDCLAAEFQDWKMSILERQ